MDDLSVMIPQRVELTVYRTENLDDPDCLITAENVIVRHIRMGDLPEVFKAVAPIQHLIKDPKQINPRMVFLEHSGEAMQLIATCLRRPLEWVKTLEIDSAVKLFSGLLEVNLDFFIKNVLPSVLQAMGKLKDASKSRSLPLGATSSPNSLQ